MRILGRGRNQNFVVRSNITFCYLSLSDALSVACLLRPSSPTGGDAGGGGGGPLNINGGRGALSQKGGGANRDRKERERERDVEESGQEVEAGEMRRFAFVRGATGMHSAHKQGR